MSNTIKHLYGEEIQCHGHGDPVLISAPEASLQLSGSVNVVNSASGTAAGISFNGEPLLDYVGTEVIYTDPDNTLTTTDSFITADHPDSDGPLQIRLPLISSLTSPKKYRIHFKGSLRMSTRYVRILAKTDPSDTTIGDTFDNIGDTNTVKDPDVWDNAHVDYHRRGTIEIQSEVGGTPKGTLNNWRIISSHLEDYSLLKTPVHAASTANLTFPIFAGNVVDGVTLVAGDRLLLKDQTDAKANGVYIVSVDAQHPDVRAHDMVANTTYASGFEFRVTSGTVHKDKKFYVSNAHGSDRVAVDNLVFKQVAGQLLLAKPAGPVVQLTNINTPVTVDSGAGKIQTVSMTTVSHGGETFTVNNTECLADSIILATIQSYDGSGIATVTVTNILAGSFDLIISNAGGVNLNDVAIVGFVVA